MEFSGILIVVPVLSIAVSLVGGCSEGHGFTGRHRKRVQRLHGCTTSEEASFLSVAMTTARSSGRFLSGVSQIEMMTKIILAMTTSLDGFVADENNSAGPLLSFLVKK